MYAIAITDINWYRYFLKNPVPKEINFWTPSKWNVRRLKEGDKFLFLLKAPYRKICGFGSFKYYENLTIREAWDRFGTSNGVESLVALRGHSITYARRHSVNNLASNDDNREIGCIVLSDVKFFSEEEFISTEEFLKVPFPLHTQKLKYFDMDLPSGLFENTGLRLPEEVLETDSLFEGSKKQITVNAYERNPIARRKCLEHYGYNCTVCKFNFFERYGEIGTDFIHVHHLKELKQIGREYEINAIQDLRPVCPNCHAMLHKREPAYSISELQEIINKFSIH